MYRKIFNFASCSFDWNSKEVIPNDESKVVEVVATASGTVHALLFWWTLDMDREGQIILSCAPPWAHPEGTNLMPNFFTHF